MTHPLEWPPTQHCRHCPSMWGGPVFHEGEPAPICWVAEALGEQEVKLGRPLIGPSGQVFSKLLVEAGLDRSKQFLMNVVSCRPPSNQVDEAHISACKDVMECLINHCNPRVIVALGSVAMKALLGSKTQGVTTMRGKVVNRGTIPVVVTLHPSFIMRKESEARAGDRVSAMYHKSVVSDFMLARSLSEKI
jgi:uracil-DNA glycosylase family 4